MNALCNILMTQSGLSVDTLNNISAGQAIFGVSFLFVLMFLGKVLMIFTGSAIISKLLRLDKAYDNLHDHEKT